MKKNLDINIISKDLDEVKIKNKDRIISFLSLYREGEYIYPSVVARNCKITYQEAVSTLRLISLLKECFQYRCHVCSAAVRHFIDIDKEDDEDIYCDECDSKIDKTNKVIYFSRM